MFQTQSANVFGGAKQGFQTPMGSAFPQTNANPFGQPPSNFTQPTTGAGIFGQPQQSGGILGPNTNGGGVFGKQTNSPIGGGAFGNSPNPFNNNPNGGAFGQATQPSFGASNPSSFGGQSNNPFSAPQNNNPFGQAQNGGMNAPTTNPFSQPTATTGMFGATATTNNNAFLGGNQNNSFGAQQNSNPFAQQNNAFPNNGQNTAFGTNNNNQANNNQLFGTFAPSGQQTNAFNQPNNPFNQAQQNNTGSPFGQSNFPAPTNPFAQPQNTQNTGITSNPFGQTNPSPFGQTNPSPFGQPNPSPFGQTNPSPFGQQPTATSPFATNNTGTGVFGQGGQSNTGGMQFNNPMLAKTPQNSPFGAPNSTFGNNTGLGTAPFDANNKLGGTTWGVPTPNNLGGQQANTAMTQFHPVKSKNTGKLDSKHLIKCIAALDQFSTMSKEELRINFLQNGGNQPPLMQANQTGLAGKAPLGSPVVPSFGASTNLAASTIYNQPQNNTPNGFFNQQQQSPIGQGVFGGNPTPIGGSNFAKPAFGSPLLGNNLGNTLGQAQPNTGIFGAGNQLQNTATNNPGIFGQPSGTTGMFGQQPAATTGMFGQTATNPGMFGQTAQVGSVFGGNQTQTGLFGQTAPLPAQGANSAFGGLGGLGNQTSAFSSTNSGGSNLFGGSNTANQTGLFSSPSFGGNLQTNSAPSGLFGANTQQAANSNIVSAIGNGLTNTFGNNGLFGGQQNAFPQANNQTASPFASLAQGLYQNNNNATSNGMIPQFFPALVAAQAQQLSVGSQEHNDFLSVLTQLLANIQVNPNKAAEPDYFDKMIKEAGDISLPSKESTQKKSLSLFTEQ